MPKLSVLFGVLLVIVGCLGYFGAMAGLFAAKPSPTALIPAALGILLMLCGFIGIAKEGARKHAMHVAAVVALLGLLGSFPGLMKFPALLGGGELERPIAVMAQTATALLCLIFFLLCFQSFLKARVLRKQG